MADEDYVCPECSQVFDRPQSLGAHRFRKHGVKGQSGRASARRKSPSRAQAQPSNGVQINRDALLQTIFPKGIPPKEEVLAQAHDWLAEADRLAHV